MTKIESSDFKRLIGIWKTTGQILTGNKTLNLSGMDSYEFILGENYILHKADVKRGNEKSETFEIISFDIATEKAKMQYFNSKGESGLMTSQIRNGNFQIEGNRIKFSGTINDENTEIKGKWYMQSDNKNWKEFIELKLEKQKIFNE